LWKCLEHAFEVWTLPTSFVYISFDTWSLVGSCMFIKKGGVVILTFVNIPESVSFSRSFTIFWQSIRWDDVHADVDVWIAFFVVVENEEIDVGNSSWSKVWATRRKLPLICLGREELLTASSWTATTPPSLYPLSLPRRQPPSITVSHSKPTIVFLSFVFPLLSKSASRHTETMVNGLAVGPALLRHENWIHDVVRRFLHNTTESSPLTTAHGVNHLPLSSAHRKRLISVDTILEVRPTRPSVSEF
jgi:hypothetical protein